MITDNKNKRQGKKDSTIIPSRSVKVSRHENHTHSSVISKGIKKKKFHIEKFEAKQCSYLLLGDEVIKQEEYTCYTCDPNRRDRICKDCFENCHKNCKINPKYEPYVGMADFICDCGSKNKHFIVPIETEIGISPCNLIKLNKKIKTKFAYRCIDDNIKICSICFFECHFDCSEREIYDEAEEIEKFSNTSTNYDRLENDFINPNKENNLALKNDLFIDDNSLHLKSGCQCRHENHSTMNEFIFNIEPEQYKEECKLPNLNPIQFLNSLFSLEVFNNLADYVVQYIKEEKRLDDIKFANIIYLASNFFTNKLKYYYFHLKALEMVPYDDLIIFMHKLRSESRDEILLKIRFYNILYYTHLKRDFQFVKGLTISDFLSSSILERLLHRKYLFSESKYTEILHKKYLFKDIKDNKQKDKIEKKYLTKLILNICEILEKGHKKLDFKHNHIEFTICLRIICNTLKRCIFHIKQLKKMIKLLYPFLNSFLQFLAEENKKLNNYVEIFSYLAKIFYLISVHFNDLIILEGLKKGEKSKLSEVKEKYKQFIHCFSDEGSLLFKMVIKSCSVLTSYYKANDHDPNDPNIPLINFTTSTNSNFHKDKNKESKRLNLPPKVIKIFNETLKFLP